MLTIGSITVDQFLQSLTPPRLRVCGGDKEAQTITGPLVFPCSKIVVQLLPAMQSLIQLLRWMR
jgi:hypothetical protein